MEVILGFQKTEVGIVSSEWTVSDITQLIEKSNGIKIGPFGSQLKKELLTSYGYKVYGQENIYEKDMEIGKRYISKDHYNRLASCELVMGDFIISMMGTIGKCMIVPKLSEPGIMDSHLIRLRLNKRKLQAELLLHFFSSQILLDQVKRLSVGGIMDGLSSKIIRNIIVPLPPTIAEQSAIATALNDADALITQLEKLISKKRAIKQGAMQELLKPKKDWVKKTLGEVATLKARIGWQGLTTAEYRKTGDYFLITGTEFRNGFIDWGSCFYVDAERYKQDKNIQVKAYDVLVTKDGTIGKVALIKSVPKPATLNSGVFVIRPTNNSFHPEFFYYLLLSEVFLIFLSQLSAGSTIIHLYQKDFVTFKFSTPKTLEEQTRIAQILSDMDTEIEVLEKKLTKYKKIKQGMMQELLTGRIRLI
jgi:type I restriction enzyme S subunit